MAASVSGPRRIAVAAAAFAAAAALAPAADRGWLAGADRRAFEAVRARRGVTAVKAARMISALAEPEVVYPVLATAGIAAARQGGWWRAGTPCLVVAGGAVARRRLSRVIGRRRPPAEAWLIEPEGFSLPSKHTTLAVLAAGATATALGARGPPCGRQRWRPPPGSAPAVCAWACTGRPTWWRAGCSPRAGYA